MLRTCPPHRRRVCHIAHSVPTQQCAAARVWAQDAQLHQDGTTICGLVFADGVVLGADTHATAGHIVAQKNCDNIYCEMIASQLTLMRLNARTDSRVVMALTRLKRHLFRNMGYVSAALWPHGSTSTLPYVMGSGSLAAMAVFEKEYTRKEQLDRAQATDLVQRAIRSGIDNDLGSGSNVDLGVITKDGTDNVFKFKQGTTSGVAQGLPGQVQQTAAGAARYLVFDRALVRADQEPSGRGRDGQPFVHLYVAQGAADGPVCGRDPHRARWRRCCARSSRGRSASACARARPSLSRSWRRSNGKCNGERSSPSARRTNARVSPTHFEIIPFPFLKS